MLRRCSIEEMNLGRDESRKFQTKKHFSLEVSQEKTKKNFLRSGVFSLTRQICSHSSKAVVVSGLLVLKVNGNLKKRQEFTIS